MNQLSKKVGRIALVITFALFFALSSFAQFPSGAGIQVFPLDATPAHTGDMVEFAIHLDGSAVPGKAMKGFHLDLSLHPDVSWVGLPELDLNHIDFENVSASDVQVVLSTGGKIEIDAAFPDLHRTAGEVGRFTLQADNGPINPDKFIADGGAGLIVVEDIGFKRPAPEATNLQSEIQVFPNPFRETLQFTLENNPPQAIVIHDCQGKEIDRITGESLELKTWNASLYPSGTYWLTAAYSNGNRTTKMIVKE